MNEDTIAFPLRSILLMPNRSIWVQKIQLFQLLHTVWKIMKAKTPNQIQTFRKPDYVLAWWLLYAALRMTIIRFQSPNMSVFCLHVKSWQILTASPQVLIIQSHPSLSYCSIVFLSTNTSMQWQDSPLMNQCLFYLQAELCVQSDSFMSKPSVEICFPLCKSPGLCSGM